MKRSIALLAGVAGVAVTAVAVAAWLRERQRKTVYAAKDAPALLNPLRHVLTPVGFTLKAFGIARRETVLELGPGPGYFTLSAGRIVGVGGRIVCVDLQREMIEILKSRADEANVRNVEGLTGNAHALPLRGASFDRAYLVTVLGEVPDPDLALRELHRVLRPGATLAFCETLLDPDYVRVPVLRARAGLVHTQHVWVGHGYIACFQKPLY
jgi:SAM-dependent methyltransferase